jgi:hypothetical protein
MAPAAAQAMASAVRVVVREQALATVARTRDVDAHSSTVANAAS